MRVIFQRRIQFPGLRSPLSPRSRQTYPRSPRPTPQRLIPQERLQLPEIDSFLSVDHQPPNIYPLITRPLKIDNNPSNKPIDFIGFLYTLNDITSYIVPTNALLREKNPLVCFKYTDSKALYLEGMKSLLTNKFKTLKDATLSLKAVIMRSFKVLTCVCKDKCTSTIYYSCSRTKGKRSEKDNEISNYFSSDFSFTNDHCKWGAKLSYDTRTKSYFFSEISPLSDHVASCFTGGAHKSNDLIKLAIKENQHGRLRRFNTSLANKVGIQVTNEDIRMHFDHEKRAEGYVKPDYIQFCPDEIRHNEKISDEDKEIIGALMEKQRQEGKFKHSYSFSKENELDFIAFIQLDQIEALSLYGDLIFIDSTFDTNSKKYNTLNFCVIDQNFKTVIGAVAFVKRENIESYKKLLLFIKDNVIFKRLPICMISDGAHIIHKAVASVFPYTKHIYCAFHLLRDGNIFGKKKNVLSPKEKNTIKDYVKTILVSESQIKVDKAVNELIKIRTAQNDDEIIRRLTQVIGHSVNGSRPQQNVFTADTISSSRVESMNAIIKRAKINRTIKLLDSILKMNGIIQGQSISRKVFCTKKWAYVFDNNFLICFNEEPMVSDGVMVEMYREYLLVEMISYEIIKVTENYYEVKCIDNPEKEHDVHQVLVINGTLYCQCCIRMGHPCRHMFVVAKFFRLKISKETINSRFYLDQSSLNWFDVNAKSWTIMMNSLNNNFEKYGEFLRSVEYSDINMNGTSNLNVGDIFTRDLLDCHRRMISQRENEEIRVNPPETPLIRSHERALNEENRQGLDESPVHVESREEEESIEEVMKRVSSLDDSELRTVTLRYFNKNFNKLKRRNKLRIIKHLIKAEKESGHGEPQRKKRKH